VGSYSPVQAVLRALSVLEAINSPDRRSLGEITNLTGLPKATVLRLIETLVAAGYVRKSDDGRTYSVTSLVRGLSAGFQTEALVSEAGGEIIKDLTQREKWPLALAILKDNQAVVCATTVRTAPLATGHSTGRRGLGLLSHALGRAYLAFCEAEERRELLSALSCSSDPVDMMAKHPERADAMIRRIRSDGYAERDPMIQPQATATIAVPVRKGDSVIASLGLTYLPAAISRKAVLDNYLPLLQSAAERTSVNIEKLRRQSQLPN
jgi:IclR family mhp operon transcriptional activator